MYDLHFSDAALRKLNDLDKKVGWRVVKRLIWLARNLDNITPEPLTGKLAGLYKFRVGDYRVLYDILDEKEHIIIYKIGHRKEIYREL